MENRFLFDGQHFNKNKSVEKCETNKILPCNHLLELEEKYICFIKKLYNSVIEKVDLSLPKAQILCLCPNFYTITNRKNHICELLKKFNISMDTCNCKLKSISKHEINDAQILFGRPICMINALNDKTFQTKFINLLIIDQANTVITKLKKDILIDIYSYFPLTLNVIIIGEEPCTDIEYTNVISQIQYLKLFGGIPLEAMGLEKFKSINEVWVAKPKTEIPKQFTKICLIANLNKPSGYNKQEMKLIKVTLQNAINRAIINNILLKFNNFGEYNNQFYLEPANNESKKWLEEYIVDKNLNTLWENSDFALLNEKNLNYHVPLTGFVLIENYSPNGYSFDKTLLIKDAIEKLIYDSLNDGKNLKFYRHGSYYNQFFIEPADKSTTNWLIDCVNQKKLNGIWSKSNFEIVPAAEIPKLMSCFIKIPNRNITDNILLQLIQTAQPQLNTSEWLILTKSNRSNNKTSYNFGIPIEDMKKMCKAHYILYVGLYKVTAIFSGYLEQKIQDFENPLIN